ncbi:MAG TPA: UDP-4-amino-4,6-dideoxy-N-acetyl-beta-L-altrosamine transaminase [Burkholderiales bacterium]|nr:UDP-4-amino-4,6-dideoxy-N-acetyl-beta-L-altrosamine transaminase [Burkholderiales bacterium]
MIPYGRQDITAADVDAVLAVLRSPFLTQGPAVPHFESLVAARVQARHAVAVNSATSALHIACLALGVGPGDRLWTVPNTFVASANCARYCGADVDFVDIDPRTWNISVPHLQEKLVRARRDGTLPKVVVPVHFAGAPTQQEAIRELSREFGFRVLEDAAHAIGAAHRGEPVGSCRWSDVAVLSFHPVKIITTAEGGMALTNDDEIAERMRLFRSHGITRDVRALRHAADVSGTGEGDAPGWYYEQQVLGYNYRMTDLHAALGSSQMARLDDYVARRNALACRYDAMLQGLPLQLPYVGEGDTSAFHLYVVRLEVEASGRTRRQVYDDLRAAGVGVNVHYMPVHLNPYYRELGFSAGMLPNAEAYAAAAITLPLYPTLAENQQDEVVAALRRALGR